MLQQENPQGSRPRVPSVESSFPLGVLAVQTGTHEAMDLRYSDREVPSLLKGFKMNSTAPTDRDCIWQLKRQNQQLKSRWASNSSTVCLFFQGVRCCRLYSVKWMDLSSTSKMSCVLSTRQKLGSVLGHGPMQSLLGNKQFAFGILVVYW